MSDWKKNLVQKHTSVAEVIKIFEESPIQFVMVIDANQKLLGTVSDGDIRRAFLSKLTTEIAVESIMHLSPIVARSGESSETILEKLNANSIRFIPLLDDQSRVIGIEIRDKLLNPEAKDNWVVLMAGGEGTRLGSLTNSCPKPMLSVGGRPILETILRNFVNHGFNKFYIAVNYRAHIIEDHFGNGSKWNAEIRYLRENQKLGTCGALSLIKDKIKSPIIMMNGDLLTKINFNQLLDFHNQHNSTMTVCIRKHELQVQYGVVQLSDHSILRIDEKPLQYFFVNAGIYVLQPELLESVPRNQSYDMTKLIDNVIQSKKVVTAFPIREYWIDIGIRSDFERAVDDYTKQFLTNE